MKIMSVVARCGCGAVYVSGEGWHAAREGAD
jgi:hypothetical protein